MFHCLRHSLFAAGLLLMLAGLRAPARPVSAGTPDLPVADTLLARVFAYAGRHELEQTAFDSEIYARHYLRTHRRNGLTRYIPGLLRMERGDNDYFGESLSRYSFRPPGEIRKKGIAAYTTMPYLHEERDRWIGRYNLSIYAPTLFSDRLLSPLNRRNRRFYRYAVTGSHVSEGRLVVSMDIRPRVHNTQLVRGDIDIEAGSGQVLRFSFHFAYAGARLHVSGEMGRADATALLPEKILLVSRFNFLGNRVEEAYEASARYTPLPVSPDTTARRSHDLTASYRFHADTASLRRDRDYFDRHRPYPLMPHQQAVYDRHAAGADTLPPDSARRRWLSPATEDLLFDSHTFSLSKQAQLKLPALFTPSMVQWSRSKGFALQTRLRFRYDFASQRDVSFTPRVGYNFRRRQVYWSLPLSLTFLPRVDGRLEIAAAGGDHMYNSRQADEVREHLRGHTDYDSLTGIFNAYNFHYYRDNHLKAMFSLRPVPGLRAGVGFRFHRRALLHWNEVAAASGMHRHLSSVAPRLHVVWTPAPYYYRDGRRLVMLRSSWPTFMFDYERGLPSTGGRTDYERIEFDAQYHLPLYALRAIYLRAGGGLYTRRGSNCFLDYDYFRDSYMPESWDDDLSGRFALLDSRWYNESRHYARLSATYESPMMLFSRLRFLTRIVQKERLYGNLLHVKRLGLYSEWGYGLSTHLTDAGVFVAIAGRGQTSVGCKVALRLFDD